MVMDPERTWGGFREERVSQELNVALLSTSLEANHTLLWLFALVRVCFPGIVSVYFSSMKIQVCLKDVLDTILMLQFGYKYMFFNFLIFKNISQSTVQLKN